MSRQAAPLRRLLSLAAMTAGLAACVQGGSQGWPAAGHGPSQLAQAAPTAHTVSYIELGIPLEGHMEVAVTMTRIGPSSWRVETDFYGHSEDVWQSQAVSDHALRLTGRHPQETSLLDLDAGTWTASIGTMTVVTAR